jgi:hypothetical protein
MPRVTLIKKIHGIPFRQSAHLLKYGDRYEVIDVESDNVLIGGMTKDFLAMLQLMELLEVHTDEVRNN